MARGFREKSYPDVCLREPPQADPAAFDKPCVDHLYRAPGCIERGLQPHGEGLAGSNGVSDYVAVPEVDDGDWCIARRCQDRICVCNRKSDDATAGLVAYHTHG